MTDQICALCGGDSGLATFEVLPSGDDHQISACVVCRDQISGESDLDNNHWFCLQESAWSEVAAVQVQSWRMLQRLSSESWAQNLLEQIYLDAETMAWAKDSGDDGPAVKTVDSNGAVLTSGDSVTLIKDLDVKGTSFVAKRGTLVKGIRLTDNPEHVEGRVNKVSIVLKTQFLKKA